MSYVITSTIATFTQVCRASYYHCFGLKNDGWFRKLNQSVNDWRSNSENIEPFQLFVSTIVCFYDYYDPCNNVDLLLGHYYIILWLKIDFGVGSLVFIPPLFSTWGYFDLCMYGRNAHAFMHYD